MATLEEKQAELDAVQLAFDEYIVSSRELEEELDAELTKSQKDLARSESRNAALVSQLANVTPQLTSLETKLSNLTTQLAHESQRRISAEMNAEEAQNKLREAEGTLQAVRSSELRKWKEECEDVYERLAFVEGEAEDYRSELQLERERHREEREECRQDVEVLRAKLRDREEALRQLQANAGLDSPADGLFDDDARPAAPRANDREDYIRTLEDELELVTEQLIASDTKLSQTQADLDLARADLQKAAHQPPPDDRAAQLEASLVALQQDHASLAEDKKRLGEELELATEELSLAKEELEASEQDARAANEDFDKERKQHKEELAALAMKLEKVASQERSREIEQKSWEDALMSSNKETEALREEADRLTMALTNAKADYDSLQEEMEELKAAFDDAKHAHDQHQEVDELKLEVKNLIETNSSLARMLKDTEQDLRNTQSQPALQEAQDEIYSLEGLLEERTKELAQLRTDMKKTKHALEGRLMQAKKDLEAAEKELAATKRTLEANRPLLEPLLEPSRNKTVRLSFSDITLPNHNFSKHNSKHNNSNLSKDTHQSDFYKSHALSRRLVSHASRTRPRSCSPTTVQRLEEDAERRAATTASLQTKCLRLQDQNRMSASMQGHLETEIQRLKQRLMQHCPPATPDEPNMNDDDDVPIDDIVQSPPKEIARHLQSLHDKLSSQTSHNAQLLKRILQLQGNIQVCCRIRPITLEESKSGLKEVTQSLSETEVGCLDVRTKSWKSFVLDKVWGTEVTQKEVFRDVEPMALSVIDGYNACIFAYGQTGSGKTYTMEGDRSKQQYGISQRTIQKIFAMLHERAQKSSTSPFEYTIQVGMLEIYNDEVYDLLAPSFSTSHNSPKKKSLEIRQSIDNMVEVPNLTKEKVTTVTEVLSALERGNSNRATASTNLNERSSRSHMILQVEVTSGVGEAKNKGCLYLVDLAGSERVRKSAVQGKALKEAQHINKSLSALGNVMEALDRKASHIPYRDSKLTYLLQNSLGGNSRTMMVVTICPHDDSYDETTFALKFATRVRRINLGSAQKNVTAKNLEETIKNLTSQMNLLSKAKERAESQTLSLKREKERVEERLAKASAVRANSKEEVRTLSVLRQSNHDITARWQKEKILREEKTLELEKAHEELRKVQKDLTNTTREKEYLTKQMEDKENSIFDLKRDLRSMKEQLNGEKIRHRRAQVMQSRIPAPSPKNATQTTTTRRSTSSQASTNAPGKPPTAVSRPTSRKRNDYHATKRGDRALTTTSSTISSETKKNDPHVAAVRSKVLKLLEEHDPTKVDKIDVVMSKFEGRENELLDRMIARYENDNKSIATVETAGTAGTIGTEGEKRAKSRQDLALERHLARMKRKKANVNKTANSETDQQSLSPSYRGSWMG